LLERRHEDFWDVCTAEAAEAAIQAHWRSRSREVGRSVSKRPAILTP
jgi:hypothetical protein